MSELRLNTDGHIIKLGADNDVTLTHVHNTGVLLNSTMQLQFNDASQNINAPSATVLDINATDEIELNATAIDLNGTLDVSGNSQFSGTITVGVDDTGKDVKLFGATASSYMLWDESANSLLLNASTIDLNGTADGLILDADADTTISSPTDDQIDIEIAGADDFTFTANTFTALTGSDVVSADYGSYRNRPNVNPLIINGDMAISQRSTSVTGVGNADSGYHTLDRWRFSEGGDNSTEFTMTQDTDVPTGKGFANSLKMDVTTADGSPGSGDAMFLQQRFEGQDLQLLKKGTASAEKITVSFWVKSPKTGVHIVELQDSDTTNARNVSISYTIASANTWEKHIVNFPADTTGALDDDNANSFEINWYLLAGTDFTSGTLATTWEARTSANRAVGQVNVGDNTSNNFYMTGVQLEVGEYTSATIPPFQHESYGNNLQRCQRYYYQVTGTGKGRFATGNFWDENDGDVIVTFPQKMRAAYSLSYSAVGDIIITSVTAEADSTALALDTSLSLDAADVRFTVGSDIATIGHVSVMILKDSGSYLSFDAEL